MTCSTLFSILYVLHCTEFHMLGSEVSYRLLPMKFTAKHTLHDSYQ